MTSFPLKFAHLSEAVERAGGARLCTVDGPMEFRALRETLRLSELPEALAGRAILIAAQPIPTIAALIALDGLARQIVLCPPDASREAVDLVMRQIRIDFLLSDRADLRPIEGGHRLLELGPRGETAKPAPRGSLKTEWALFTSGTTGVPKLVSHSLETLTDAIAPGAAAPGTIWGTFYDLRRYGGLQMLLRSILSGASLALAGENEALSAYLDRLGAVGVTHLAGTPSHWRAALMSRAVSALRPSYVRLSGEIVDQGVLDALAARFPQARVVHAFASTEAGVVFEVTDGRAGFPAGYLESCGPVDLKIVDDCLLVRSRRCAHRYVNVVDRELLDEDGYVDTSDVVEQRGDRCFFLGRRGGVINVGGLKIHPEEIEAVLNGCEGVRSSLVAARRSPILGSIVVAEVVLEDYARADGDAVVAAIQSHCRAVLAAHKVPASVRIVDALPVSPAGKLFRHG